jgi:hypothetical protein
MLFGDNLTGCKSSIPASIPTKRVLAVKIACGKPGGSATSSLAIEGDVLAGAAFSL